MKALLISPAYDIAAYMGRLSKSAFVFPPMGLMYIAGSLRDNGISVDIYDFAVADMDFPSYFRDKQPDVVGITCQTALVYSTLALCKTIKSLAPSTITVVGGVHVNLRPEDLISSADIDYCIRGEGEIAMVELLKAIEPAGGGGGSIRCAWRHNQKWGWNPLRSRQTSCKKHRRPSPAGAGFGWIG